MEQTSLSLQPHEILVVKAVEPLHVVVDIWGAPPGTVSVGPR
jgi:hypothetical protein